MELGTLAAVIQFIDVGYRLSAKLTKFCVDFRDAPQQIQRLNTDLKQQLAIAQAIKGTTQAVSSEIQSLATFEHPHQDYMCLAGNLQSLVEGLEETSHDGILQRSWKNLHSVRQRREIIEVCERLCRKESSMTMWLVSINIEVSNQIKTLLKNAQERAERSGTVIGEIARASTESAAELQHISRQIHEVDHATRLAGNRSQEVQARTEDIARSIDDRVQQTYLLVQNTEQNATSNASHMTRVLQRLQNVQMECQTNTQMLAEQNANDMTMLQREMQRLNETVRLNHNMIDMVRRSERKADERPQLPEFRLLVANNAILSDTISSLAARDEFRPHQHLPCSSTRSDKQPQHLFSHERTPAQLFSAQSRLPDIRLCECRKITRTKCWSPLAFLHFRRTFRNHHYTWCPQYRSSGLDIEVLMEIVPPTWLLAHTVSIGMKLDAWRSETRNRIFPLVIDTRRLVDRVHSPLFRAISNAKEKLTMSGFANASGTIADLHATINSILEHREASALDEDGDGNTVLSEILCIHRRHRSRGAHKSKPGDEYIKLLQLVLAYGTNLGANIKALQEDPDDDDWFLLPHEGGTVFDIYARDLLIEGQVPRTAESEIQNLTICKMLEKAGAEFTFPVNSFGRIHPNYWCQKFYDEVQELVIFPETVDLFDYGELVPLILEKSERGLLRALSRRPSLVHHSSQINGLTAQHFAVTWPVGLKHLIQADANVNAEDHNGRRPIHLAIALKAYESIHILLEADCALAPYLIGKTVLNLALDSESPSFGSPLIPTAIIEAITKAYIDRHKRLRELARRVLSLEQAQRLEIAEDVICERTTTLIREEISACGFHVPPALELGTENVYEIVDFGAVKRMAPETASTLWDAGFKDISSPNKQGLSPMLQNWHCANFEMVQWFIDKGVSPDQRHRDGNFGALHLYAQRMNYPGAYFGQQENVPNSPLLIPHLHDLKATRDDCRCLCSPAGCSPVTFLIRDYDEDYDEHYFPLRAFDVFSIWVEKTSLLMDNEALIDTYTHDMVRILAFEFLTSKYPDLHHTCCYIGQLGDVKSDSIAKEIRLYGQERSCKHAFPPGSLSTGSHGKNGSDLLPATKCEELLNQMMEMYDDWRADRRSSAVSLPWDFMKDPMIKSRYEELIDEYSTPN